MDDAGPPARRRAWRSHAIAPGDRVSKPFHRWPFHRCAIAAGLALFVFLGLYTVPDYGLMWDFWEYHIGDKNLAFYASFDWAFIREPIVDLPIYHLPDHPNWYGLLQGLQGNDAQVAPHLIWPFGPTLSSLSKLIFYRLLGVFDPIGAHHAGQVILVAVLIGLVYRFGRRHWGPWEALIAGLVLASYPRFWAHLHANVKDIPCAAMFAFVILAVASGIEKRCWKRLLAGAVLWGLALATKGNALFLPVILGPWYLYVLYLRQSRGLPPVSRPEALALGAFPFLGLAVMFAAWPLLLVDFPAQLGLYVSSLLSRGVNTSPDAAWNWLPLKNAFATMPVAVMALAAVGIGDTVRQTWRRRRLSPWRLLVLLWAIVPVARVCVPGAVDFDVIRHWLEFIPALALVAGWGGGFLVRGLFRAVRRRPVWWRWRRALALAAAIAWFTPLLVWEVRYHPNQLVFYNSLVGGLPGARARAFEDATDYWGYSYPQALRWLNAHAGQNAIVTVGVAEHAVFAVREIWLRRDLRLLPLTGVHRDTIARTVREYSGEIYLIYIVRPEWYTGLARELDPELTPVHEIEVEGATILKILRLR